MFSGGRSFLDVDMRWVGDRLPSRGSFSYFISQSKSKGCNGGFYLRSFSLRGGLGLKEGSVAHVER